MGPLHRAFDLHFRRKWNCYGCALARLVCQGSFQGRMFGHSAMTRQDCRKPRRIDAIALQGLSESKQVRFASPRVYENLSDRGVICSLI